MKNYLFFFFLFFSLIIVAQETPILINGQVLVNNTPLKDVHIINKTLDVGTISNDEGFFEIIVKKGDILIISHINLEIEEYTITTTHIKNRNITTYLKNKTYILDEVVIGNSKSIFHIDKDIMPHNLPIVNAKTLNLPYAESEAEKKDKLLALDKGISLNLEGVVNAFNGNNKLKKQFKEIEVLDNHLTAIRKKFTDRFFTHQLKIKKEYINVFLNHNISSGIIQLFKKQKYLELTSVFIENRKDFSHLKTNDSTNVSFK